LHVSLIIARFYTFHLLLQCLPNCYQGQCFNETCVCDKGYSGNECQDCSGRRL